MAKELIINTSRVNSYGSRVITSGIDLTQYKVNPILLYMHRRGWDGESLPIGRVENLRIDGDKLIGTPVFDMSDDFAVKIANKWENDFLNMGSAGLDPIEFSTDTALVLPGQTRATVTKSKLVEVSIADIGANDDCVKLYNNGKLLTLSAGEPSDIVPLLKNAESSPETESEHNLNNQTEFSMNKILLALGLSGTASEDDAVAAITALKTEAQKAETMELSRITSRVDSAVTAKVITDSEKEDYITLGKKAGYDILSKTLDKMTPAAKPTDLITHGAGGNKDKDLPETLTFSQLSEEQALELREKNRAKYIELYKKEFGFVPELD